MRHLIHAPVAGRTANAFLHVNAVIEKNEIGQLIDALPMEWLLRRETLPDRREHGRLRPNLRMTGHAGFGRRHAGECGFFDGRMAITAIDAEPGNVMLMAERHWLRDRNILFGRIGRAIHRYTTPQNRKNPRNTATTVTRAKLLLLFAKI